MALYKISELAKEISERENNPSSSIYKRFVGLEHFVSGDIVINNYGSAEKLESAMKIFHNGDILIARRNVYLKRASTVFFDGLTSGDSIVLRALKPEFARILPFIFNTKAFWDFADKYSDGTMSKRLSPNTLMQYEVNLPNDENLYKLSDLLWAANDTKEAYKKLLDKTDKLVKSQFIEMFGDPIINPFGWEKLTVQDVCSSIVRGPFGSALKVSFFVPKTNTSVKVYEQKHAIQKDANIGDYHITKEKFNELKRFECKPKDIIMSCSGTIGELYQLPDDAVRGIINQALCKFTLNNRIVPIVFLTYMRQTIQNLETKGTGIQNVGALSFIKAMPINLPPIEVQNRFAIFVESMDKSKFELQQTLEKLKSIIKMLM